MKIKPYKAVLFDLDGTLLNTLGDLANTANRVLAAKGFPTHPLDAYRYFVGEGVAKLIVRALPPEKRQDNHCIQACIEAFSMTVPDRPASPASIVQSLTCSTIQGSKTAHP